MKKRRCDNNKSVRQVKKALPLLREKFPHAEIRLVFKESKRHGSHCFNLVLDTLMGKRKITVIKTNKAYNSNLGVIRKAERFLDKSLIWEIGYHLHTESI